MARKATVAVSITGDSSGLEKATKRADTALDRLNKAGHRAGQAMKTGLAAGGLAAAAGLTASAKAAIESEKSQSKLQAQLKALGISYEKHAEQIDSVIQKQSQLSGLDDEDLQDSFTSIVRTTGDVTEALEYNAIAADLARAKHLDVAKAGDIVAKVAGGNTGILGRYGVTIKDGATATEALGALQQKFAGQAEAYGKTTAGSLDRAKVASENLGETVGAKLTPLLAKAAEGLVRVVEVVQNAWPRISRIARAVFGAVGDSVNAVAGTIRRWVSRNREDISDFLGSLRAIARVVRNVFEDVVIPIIRRLLPVIRGIFEGAVTVIRGAVKVISGILTGNFGKAWDGVKDIFRGGLKGVLSIVKGAGKLFVDAGKLLADKIIDGVKTLPGKFKDVIVGVGGIVGDIGRAIADWLNDHTPFGDRVNLPGPLPNFTLPRLARGGPVPGQGRGDTVHAMLEPGEYVVRKDAVNRVGLGFMDTLNNGALRGFASGGPVGRASSSGRYSHDELARLWIKAGGNPAKADTAAAVALAESSGIPGAINTSNTDGSIDRGLWQINSIHGSLSTTNVMANARAAVKISSNGQNFTPWTVYRNGDYRDYLTGSRGGGGHRTTVRGMLPVARIIAKKFGLTVGSTFRTPAGNAEAGGVPNSWHLRGSMSNPQAADLNGPVPQLYEASKWAAANVKGLAENLVHNVTSGLHLHLAGANPSVVVGSDEAADARRAQGEQSHDVSERHAAATQRSRAGAAHRGALKTARAKRKPGQAGGKGKAPASSPAAEPAFAMSGPVRRPGELAEAVAAANGEGAATDPNAAMLEQLQIANDLAQQLVDEQKALVAESAARRALTERIYNTQTGQIMAWLAGEVSTVLGQRIGLGMQLPGYPGGRVRY